MGGLGRRKCSSNLVHGKRLGDFPAHNNIGHEPGILAFLEHDILTIMTIAQQALHDEHLSFFNSTIG